MPGQLVIDQWRRRFYFASVALAVLSHALRRQHWPRTTRDVLARQILFSGVEAISFVSHVAFWVGVSVVVQVQYWVGVFGQSRLLGPILVTVIIREFGPLMANLVVIGRSGTAVAAELGNMKITGEVRLLEAQGIDPLTYLVMPRAIGMMISVLCLAVLFIIVALGSGYLCAFAAGMRTAGPMEFTDTVLRRLQPVDLVNLLAKTLLPGLLAGCIACVEGLSAEQSITRVPQATTRATHRSVIALFAISALISVLIYV